MHHAPPDHVSATQASSALTVLQHVLEQVQEGRPADSTLQQLYRRHREFGSRDRRLYSNLVFSVLRWKGWTDLAPDQPLAVRAAASYRLDSAEPHPAIERMAALSAPERALDTLADKAEQVARWLSLPRPPAPASLIPAASHAQLAWPERDRELIESFQTRPPTWIRGRPGSEAATRALCAALNVEPLPHPRLPDAWRIDDTARLADLLSRAEGRLDVQDIASQAAGVIAAPVSDQSWWDVCTGSAGKSLHLADLTGGRLRILATDIRDSILDEARRRIHQAGRSGSIRLQRLDAAHDPLPAGPFDGVFVDAPCSGTGTWARNPDARWRWKPEAMAELIDLQALLLERASACVKPGGGVLIYATCSLTKAENTEQIARFLAAHPEFTLSPFIHPLSGAACPGQTFIWPWEGPGSGFFAARMIRS